MRKLLHAAAVFVLVFSSFAGPISAATNGSISISQATQQSATISGRVTATQSTGLSGAVVTLDGPTRASATTDAAGGFRFSVPPGDYTVTVNKGGYQTGSTQLTAVAGTPLNIVVTLVESSLGNLQVIGRTSTTASRNVATFNISSTAAATVANDQIVQRNTPDLNQLVQELPGVTVTNSASNVNHQFVVRGLDAETRITLEGHPVSTGISGQFITNYVGAPLFGAVDVLKGAGLNGPTAGTSGNGTLNLRTPEFTAKNSGFFQIGNDSFNGTLYTGLVDVNLLKDKRLSVILGKSFSGYRGPTYNQIGNDIINTSDAPFIPNTFNYTTPYLTNYTIASQSDVSNTYSLNAELAKVRYRFSEATQLGFEYIGLQGRYDPQGGAYAQFQGFATIPQCLNAKVGGFGAACTVTSVYNAPWAQNLVGQSNVPLVQFYPGSQVQQSSPTFSLDLRTTFKNDTILLRPYTANINRFIDGSGESAVPGNNGGWFQVTNTANCVNSFKAPSVANGGASGPCFDPNSPINSAAFVTDPATLHSYALTSALPNGGAGCSVALPCYTTSTKLNNGGAYGYGTPYSTFEFDKLAGYTFSYIHPVKLNTYNLSFDHYLDDTFGLFNDTTPPPAGCTYVQPPGVASNKAGAPGSQPGCSLPFLPSSPISTPETQTSVSTLALTGQFQVTPKLELDFGNYFNFVKINAQVEDPALIAAYLAIGAPASATPVSLVAAPVSFSHYDPHFGFVYRPSREVSFRGTFGSSIVVPYANQLSGFTKINQGAASTTLSQPNNALKPEEIVSASLGMDARLFNNGTVFSGDVWNTTVHNPWITSSQIIPNLPQIENTPFTLLSTLTNGPEKHSQGIELGLANEPVLGFGYRLTSTFQRVYFLNLPASFFSTIQSTYNGKQVDGIPYSKGYAEVRYAGTRNFLIRLGADYEGPNNAYNYPAFVQLDAGARLGLGDGFVLQGSVENLSNLNFGNQQFRAVQAQGGEPIGAQIVNNQFVYGPKQPQFGIVGPVTRTYRFTLSRRF